MIHCFFLFCNDNLFCRSARGLPAREGLGRPAKEYLRRLGAGCLTIFILFMLPLMLIHCGKKTDVVAKVENQEITVEQFRRILQDQFKTRDLSFVSAENKQRVLMELINERLKALKARKLGLDQDPEFLLAKETRGKQLIYQKLFEREIIDKLIPESLLKKYFQWQNLEVSAIYILLGYEETLGYKGNRTKEEAETLAAKVIEELKISDNPQQVAAAYSDDLLVGRNQGEIDNFPIGRFTPEVDEAVFTANPGEAVGPFPTDRGLVIFKILNKQEKAVRANFSQAKDALREKLRRSYFSEQSNQRHQELTRQLLNKYKAEILEEGVNEFYDILKEWGTTPQPNDSDFTSQQREIPLGVINHSYITIGDLIDQFRGRFSQVYTRYDSPQQLNSLVQQMLNWEAWAIEAQNQELQKDPGVAERLETFGRSQLARLLDYREIKEKVEVTADDIAAYYEANQAAYAAQGKGLEEVREMIRAVVRSQKETERRRKITEQLQKEFSFQINDEILRSLN